MRALARRVAVSTCWSCGWAVRRERVLDQFAIAENDQQQIVELVGHAPSQGPERLEPLRVPELHFQVAVRGDVAQDHHDALHGIVLATDQGATVGDEDLPAVPGAQHALRGHANVVPSRSTRATRLSTG